MEYTIAAIAYSLLTSERLLIFKLFLLHGLKYDYYFFFCVVFLAIPKLSFPTRCVVCVYQLGMFYIEIIIMWCVFQTMESTPQI